MLRSRADIQSLLGGLFIGACLEDDGACEAVMEVVDVEHLVRAARARFSDAAVNIDGLEREWKRIHETLASLVTARGFGAPI